MTRYVMIALGGAVGALARYGLALWIQQRAPTPFPLGTFVVNISGCLVMGIAMTLLTERSTLSPNWRFLIPIGFIGAYTTFSTFELETFRAIEEGTWPIALANVLLSVIVGYVALWAGTALARSVL